MGLFQFLQHIICWIVSDVFIIDSDLKHLMQYIMNPINRRDFQNFLICQPVIKTSHIRLFYCN